MTGRAKSAGARRPGRPKAGSEDKRARILSEAMALFATRGYAGTSLADIAGASDISKAGLLHHFFSKDHLLAEVLAERARHSMRHLPTQRESVADTLDTWLAILGENAEDPEGVALYTAMSGAVIDRQHRAHAWFSDHLDFAISFLRDALEAGKATGEVRSEAPSGLIARHLVALSDGMQLQWLCDRADGVEDADMTAVVSYAVGEVKRRWLVGGAGGA